MKYRTFDEIRPVADIKPVTARTRRQIRRERLERLAHVLESSTGPIRLLSRIEYYPEEERLVWREEHSPLYVAFADETFRREGLGSDRFGDVMTFFDLSAGEAHHLFCDCHYPGRITPQAIADRVRSTARGGMFRQMWDAVSAAFV